MPIYDNFQMSDTHDGTFLPLSLAVTAQKMKFSIEEILNGKLLFCAMFWRKTTS